MHQLLFRRMSFVEVLSTARSIAMESSRSIPRLLADWEGCTTVTFEILSAPQLQGWSMILTTKGQKSYCYFESVGEAVRFCKQIFDILKVLPTYSLTSFNNSGFALLT
ncbi:hypothetical protein H2248_004460 [Termitomyces sp. 'cryptogamus']|nr:hypothetical protein H2248_004460 [Termitomyces sp. 'cryptogamus']